MSQSSGEFLNCSIFLGGVCSLSLSRFLGNLIAVVGWSGSLMVLGAMDGCDACNAMMEAELICRHHAHEPREHQCSSVIVRHVKAPANLVSSFLCCWMGWLTLGLPCCPRRWSVWLWFSGGFDLLFACRSELFFNFFFSRCCFFRFELGFFFLERVSDYIFVHEASGEMEVLESVWFLGKFEGYGKKC